MRKQIYTTFKAKYTQIYADIKDLQASKREKTIFPEIYTFIYIERVKWIPHIQKKMNVVPEKAN